MRLDYPDHRPPRRVQRGGRTYRLVPGEQLDVAPRDVAALEELGATRPTEAGPDTAGTRGLDALDRDELYKLAQQADVPGRSTMTRSELLEALADNEE